MKATSKEISTRLVLGYERGNNFGRGWEIAPAPAGARAGVDTMLYVGSRIHS